MRGRLPVIILVIAILGVIGAAIYIVTLPKIEERFTEFYILGLEGKAEDYPSEVVVGVEAKLLVSIINREQETVNYELEVNIDGVRNNDIGPIVLDDGQQWEELVGFTPDRVGDNQKVEFLLFQGEGGSPYLELYLWINVSS